MKNTLKSTLVSSAVVCFLLFTGRWSFSEIATDTSSIGAGDFLTISFARNHDLDTSQQVNEDGTIKIVFLGGISVINLTTSEAADKITTLLADGYLVDPQVTVIVDAKIARSPEGAEEADGSTPPALEEVENVLPGRAIEETSSSQTYEVQTGDTLGSIAKKVYGSASQWNRIAEANSQLFPGDNFTMLSLGMILTIPPLEERIEGNLESDITSTDPLRDQEEQTYTVQANDTLGVIAEKFYGDSRFWRKVYEANQDRLPNPDILETGQILRIRKKRKDLVE